MRICKGESIVLKDRSYEFAFALKYFVEHLLIINVVGPLVSALFTDIVDHLCLGDRSKFLKRVEWRLWVGENILAAFLLFLFITLFYGFGVVKVSPWPIWSVVSSSGYEKRKIIFNITQSFKDAHKTIRTKTLFLLLQGHWKLAISVAQKRGTWSACVFSAHTYPFRFELGLNRLQSFKGSHVSVTPRNLLLRIIVILRHCPTLCLLTAREQQSRSEIGFMWLTCWGRSNQRFCYLPTALINYLFFSEDHLDWFTRLVIHQSLLQSV